MREERRERGERERAAGRHDSSLRSHASKPAHCDSMRERARACVTQGIASHLDAPRALGVGRLRLPGLAPLLVKLDPALSPDALHLVGHRNRLLSTDGLSSSFSAPAAAAAAVSIACTRPTHRRRLTQKLSRQRRGLQSFAREGAGQRPVGRPEVRSCPTLLLLLSRSLARSLCVCVCMGRAPCGGGGGAAYLSGQEEERLA